ncbi:MAG TPA: DinB family protein [Jatrophihabitans sp.]|jgi:hypothetical protein
MTEVHDVETTALMTFLDAQRDSVLAIVADLDTVALASVVLPSGWTPLGLLKHLGFAERHWFQGVALGAEQPVRWPDGSDEGDHRPFRTDLPAEAVFAFYREQISRSNSVLASTALSTPPVGRHPGDDANEVTDLRWIVLHMIEETARHAGHLDIARELLDGRTGLGPR